MPSFRMHETIDPTVYRDEQNGRASFRRGALIGFATTPLPLVYQLQAMMLARPVHPIVVGFADKVAR